MTLSKLNKAPFPYAGGKSKAAAAIWAALGDVEHYVEPFAGSCAVLLERPHEANRAYYSETVNDLDGMIVNFWRSVQLHPHAVAEAASWPVSEADLHARNLTLVRWRESQPLERLMGVVDYCDPVLAGYWVWGLSAWIGSGFAVNNGPWTEIGGIFTKQSRDAAREPGVSRQIPHLYSDGQGVNTQTAREPGVWRQIPHLHDDGRGVNTQTAREPGIARLSDPLPTVDEWQAIVNADYADSDGFHPVTMPEIRRWMHYLSARLRHVRIVNGDWKRVVTPAASQTLSIRKPGGVCGIFFDPPYGDAAGRDMNMYAHESGEVAGEVLRWCIDNTENPKYRIVIAGYDVEHTALEDVGWTPVEWFKGGFLTGGYGNQNKARGHQQNRERLWMSPTCAKSVEQSADADTLFASAVAEPIDGEQEGAG